MEVIRHATNEERGEMVLPRDAAQIGPDALLDVRLEPRLATFGAEDEVLAEAGKGVRHRWVETVSGVATRRTRIPRVHTVG